MAAVIQAPALRLEPLSPDHAEAMFAPMSAPEIYRYTPGVHALYATVDPANERSLRLLARLGFIEVPPARYPHGATEPGDRVFSLACSTSRATRASSPPSSSSS